MQRSFPFLLKRKIAGIVFQLVSETPALQASTTSVNKGGNITFVSEFGQASWRSFLHRHDQVLPDVIVLVERVLAHVKAENVRHV